MHNRQLGDTEWWMVADFQLRCSESGTSPIFGRALLASLAWPLGMPAALFGLLCVLNVWHCESFINI